MSWKDKDWDFLRFYNNERSILEAAAERFFQCPKDKSVYLDGTFMQVKYDREELVIYRFDKDIWPPNEYDKRMLQYIANKYDVCIKYTWLSSYKMFDLKPTPEE